MKATLEKLVSKGFAEKVGQFHEVISLFFFHFYRKFARETALRLLSSSSVKTGK